MLFFFQTTLALIALKSSRHSTQEMEAWLIGLPRGSVVHYDANGFLPPVLPAKLEALKASCQKKGVSFIESPVN